MLLENSFYKLLTGKGICWQSLYLFVMLALEGNVYPLLNTMSPSLSTIVKVGLCSGASKWRLEAIRKASFSICLNPVWATPGVLARRSKIWKFSRKALLIC